MKTGKVSACFYDKYNSLQFVTLFKDKWSLSLVGEGGCLERSVVELLVTNEDSSHSTLIVLFLTLS